MKSSMNLLDLPGNFNPGTRDVVKESIFTSKNLALLAVTVKTDLAFNSNICK